MYFLTDPSCSPNLPDLPPTWSIIWLNDQVRSLPVLVSIVTPTSFLLLSNLPTRYYLLVTVNYILTCTTQSHSHFSLVYFWCKDRTSWPAYNHGKYILSHIHPFSSKPPFKYSRSTPIPSTSITNFKIYLLSSSSTTIHRHLKVTVHLILLFSSLLSWELLW